MARDDDQAAEVRRLKRELQRVTEERDILNVWPAPSARGGVKDGKVVCINVSGLKTEALAKMDIRAA